jgi:hypothetical protein
MEKYKAKQREKECRPEPPTQEQRDAVVVKLQEVFAANRLMAEQAKSRKEWISKSTQDWIDENLSDISNPYHGKK